MSLEFAFSSGENNKSILNHDFNSSISAECLHSLSMQPGSQLLWLLTRLELPLECSHLLMNAVISLGCWKFHSLIWNFGCIIHLEQLPPYVNRYRVFH